MENWRHKAKRLENKIIAFHEWQTNWLLFCYCSFFSEKIFHFSSEEKDATLSRFLQKRGILHGGTFQLCNRTVFPKARQPPSLSTDIPHQRGISRGSLSDVQVQRALLSSRQSELNAEIFCRDRTRAPACCQVRYSDSSFVQFLFNWRLPSRGGLQPIEISGDEVQRFTSIPFIATRAAFERQQIIRRELVKLWALMTLYLSLHVKFILFWSLNNIIRDMHTPTVHSISLFSNLNYNFNR